MASIHKKETFSNCEFQANMNFDYAMSVGLVLKDLVSTSQEAFMVNARDTLDAGGYGVGAYSTGLFGTAYELEVLSYRITPMSSTSARVVVNYGTPTVSATIFEDPFIKWVWEDSSTVRTEQQAWNVDKVPLLVEYWPKISGVPMSATDWAKDDNKRRFRQSHTAARYRPWQTAVCRARIRWDYLDATGANDATSPQMHPRAWHMLLAGKVNDEIKINNDVTIPAGVWMCQGLQVSTPNNELLYEVRATFAYNEYGWDPVILFKDPNNQNKVPYDVGENITAHTQFALPYPADADRILKTIQVGGAPADVYTGGGIKPKMHAKMNFAADPYFIDLKQVSGY
jgi:hypothetical protein